MEKAKQVRDMPVTDRPHGYVFVDRSRKVNHGIYSHRFEVVDIETNIRYGERDFTFYCQVSDMDRMAKTYGMFVFLDENGHKLLLMSSIRYWDRSRLTVEHETIIADNRFANIAETVVLFLHAIVHEWFIRDCAPMKSDGSGRSEAWYRIFTQTDTVEITAGCGVSMRALIAMAHDNNSLK